MEGYIAGVFVLTIIATAIVIGIWVRERQKNNSAHHQTNMINKAR